MRDIIPHKLEASRVKGQYAKGFNGVFQMRFGEESWELDALSPAFISNLIRDAINGVIDKDIWDDSLRAETEDKRYLEELANDGGSRDFD